MKLLTRASAGAAIVGAALAAYVGFGSAGAQEPTTITADAGDGEVGYAVNLFLPAELTVETGTIVSWEWPWFEPHSVTFGTPTGDPSVPSNPEDEVVAFDGETYFSSGLVFGNNPEAVPFKVQFNTAGEYQIYCILHPNMLGTVTVVDSGDVDTQEEADARAAAEYEPELAAIKAVAAGLTAAPVAKETLADGSTKYTVVVAAATMDADAMQYFPPSLNIEEGDTVLFSNTNFTPHSVNFGPYQGQDPFETPAQIPAGGYDGTGSVYSGIIGNDFPAGNTMQLKFTKAGSYDFYCILHADQGQVGTINVSAATTPPPTTTTTVPTATPTKVAPKPPATGTGSDAGSTPGAVWLAGMALALLGAGAAAVAVARNSRS